MQLGQLKRREFITLLGGAAIVGWPLAARAQQAAIPLVGFLNSGSPEVFADRLRAFNQGLKEVPALPKERMSGSCTCWAVDQYDRLPELAAELVQRRVAVIAANNAAALPAKAEVCFTSIIRPCYGATVLRVRADFVL